MRKILIFLISILFFSILSINRVSAFKEEFTNEYIQDFNSDYDIEYNDGFFDYNEDYQEGYRRGYEDGFSHDNRVKIVLWTYENIDLRVLDTVYRYNYNGFVSRYDIVSGRNFTSEQLKNKIFIPTFEGFVGSFNTSVRQWFLGVNNLHLYVEKSIIDSIMSRDSVDEITAFRTYLEENNVYGYFERVTGETDYQLGYNNGYNAGFKDGSRLMYVSDLSKLVLPVVIVVIIVNIFYRFKNDNIEID